LFAAVVVGKTIVYDHRNKAQSASTALIKSLSAKTTELTALISKITEIESL
jgi:hypothetical protein